VVFRRNSRSKEYEDEEFEELLEEDLAKLLKRLDNNL
jgi:hypothetical protein